MVRVSYILVPEGYDQALYRNLRPGDRFVLPRLGRKQRFISYPKRQALLRRTLLPIVAPLWNALSAPVKANWASAASQMGTSGYKLFVQDTCERIRLELSGLATPSDLHQTFVGLLHTEAPANNILLVQPHPRVYYNQKKVTGTKSQYTLVQITEAFSLPLSIAISYKSNLTADGPDPRARFFAQVRSLYQGRNIITTLALDFDLVSGWVRLENELTAVQGKAISYNLYLEINDAHGDLWIDNVASIHSGQNWARDPYCKNIKQSFTRVYYQVPKAWAPEELPLGADYGSIYVDS